MRVNVLVLSLLLVVGVVERGLAQRGLDNGSSRLVVVVLGMVVVVRAGMAVTVAAVSVATVSLGFLDGATRGETVVGMGGVVTGDTGSRNVSLDLDSKKGGTHAARATPETRAMVKARNRI